MKNEEVKRAVESCGSTLNHGLGLINRLKIKAAVMEMGEKIEWGSDTILMREAANELMKLYKHIADIGESMKTKARNNPNGLKSGTIDELADELLSAIDF